MPVLIAARSSALDLVRPLARLLRADGGEVRCYLDTDDYELRELGCKIAVGALDDAYNLDAALTRTHTFIPVLPDPFEVVDADDVAQLRAVGLAAAEAAESSDVARTILPIPVLPDAHPVQPAYDEVAKAFSAGRKPLCRIRTGALLGPDRPLAALLQAVQAHNVEVPASVILSVLDVDAWAATLAAADDREELDGTWELGGDVEPLADLVQAAGRLPRTPPPPSPWGLALLNEDLVVGQSAAEAFLTA